MPPLGHLLAPAAVLLLTEGAWAQGPSLFTGVGLQATRGSLLREGPRDAAPAPLVRARAEVPDTAEAEEARARAQSLFIGRTSGGLFAPLAPRDRGHSGGVPNALEALCGPDPEARMIRDLIARAEAGPKAYDAVQYGARRKPDRPPTEMTLGDIFAWIEATPDQPHAIGRYQFIPPTLARLADFLGAGPHQRFSPDLQDRLADVLLHEAGLARYRSGAITRHAFMNNLARIWAGLPNSSGRSHYRGYAGNAATTTWSEFDGEMARIFRS